MSIFDNLLQLDNYELIKILNYKGEKQQELWNYSKNIKNKIFSNGVFIRGLIEFSNICQKNCLYCGIRKDNNKVKRYRLDLKDIIECVDFTVNNGIKSIVLQSGELTTESFKDYLRILIKTIKTKYDFLNITLSCGEFDYNFFKELRELGVNRYLLRIETSNPELYKKLHPSDHYYQKRLQALYDLDKSDYQVGTGDMIGTPNQTDNDIINDLRFFVDEKFDMYGLGPYIIHTDTPLATKENIDNWNKNKEDILNKTLNFLCMLRICVPIANIAAATALDVLSDNGRLTALKIASNVIMPAITPKNNRKNYQLYQNKPNIDDDGDQTMKLLQKNLENNGLKIIYTNKDSSLHYINKTKNRNGTI